MQSDSALEYTGFNSATAVMPWRFEGKLVQLYRRTSFNSATAVMPWRLPLEPDSQ